MLNSKLFNLKVKKHFYIIAIFFLSYFTFIQSQHKHKAKTFCGMEVCLSEGSYCGKENRCVCQEGYMTVENIHQKNLKCNYKLTSSIKAGTIELLFGCGFGHFYAGRTGIGLFKLFCVSLFCTCCLGSLYMMKKIREETEAQDHPYVSLIVLLSVIYKIIMVIWQITDGFLFFLKIYKDGNDMPLY